MMSARRYALAGAGVAAAVNLVVQGWGLIVLYRNQDRVFQTYDAGFSLLDLAITLVAQTLVAVAIGALLGMAVAMVRRSRGMAWAAAGAAILAVATVGPLLVSGAFGGPLSPDLGLLLAILAVPVLATAAVGAAAGALWWYLASRHSGTGTQWLLIGAATAMGLRVLLQAYRYVDAGNSTDPFALAVRPDLATTAVTLLWALPLVAALGALVGGAAFLARISAGWPAIAAGATTGVATAVAPSLARYLGKDDSAGSAEGLSYLAQTGPWVVFNACVMASAAALLWYFTVSEPDDAPTAETAQTAEPTEPGAEVPN